MDTPFKGINIRARADKTPEQRKANSRIYGISQHIKNSATDYEVDADYRRSKVWVGDYSVVSWNMNKECFEWDDHALSTLGLALNKEEAEAHSSAI